MTCKGCLLHPEHREFVKVGQKTLEWPEATPSGNPSSVFWAGGCVAPHHLAGNMWCWWQHVCAGGDHAEWDAVTTWSPYVKCMPREDTQAELFGWPVPLSQQNKPTNILSTHGCGIYHKANLSLPRNGFIKEKVACFPFINTIICLGRCPKSFEAVSWQRWRWGGWVGLVTGSVPAPVSTAAGARRHKSSFFPRSIQGFCQEQQKLLLQQYHCERAKELFFLRFRCHVGN